ncbi:hypothetical protein [Candidatus Sororendozoicomonas aggregata]|uniref:hypothetical protein n=1 Tax=Candidatus Sororendozoicomonas aggregata TaxID=3073239 RepID=UPI002ECFED05
MNKLLLAIVTFISTVILTNVSFADIDENGLQVYMVNATDYTCKLTNKTLKHGYWYKKPPDTVKPDETAYWAAIKKALHGPDMDLTFKCGAYSFSVINQQNVSILAGGDQNNKTYHVDGHLSVIIKEIQHASWKDDKPGVAQIVVSLN